MVLGIDAPHGKAIEADQARLDRRRAILRAVRIKKRLSVETDPVAIVALVKMRDAIPPDILSDADTLIATQPRATSHMERPEVQGDPLILKVSIAGSGADRWEHAVSKGRDGEELDWTRADNMADPHVATFYEREGGEGPELAFSGPGGMFTKGDSLGGLLDRGSNSIEHLVEQVPLAIQAEVDQDKEITGIDRPILVILKGHSRGAVAAGRVSKAIKERYGDRVAIELLMIDPVMGPGHHGEDVKIDLGEIDEFTLVYSTATGYLFGFTPQMVMNAKRIIVSRQNHSAGYRAGFRWRGVVYRGSRLCEIDPGVYVDLNADDENTVELIHVTDIVTAHADIRVACRENTARTGDFERLDIIEVVLRGYFARAGGS